MVIETVRLGSVQFIGTVTDLQPLALEAFHSTEQLTRKSVSLIPRIATEKVSIPWLRSGLRVLLISAPRTKYLVCEDEF